VLVVRIVGTLDKTVVEPLDLENQAMYEVSPQYWPHGENSVRGICIYSVQGQS